MQQLHGYNFSRSRSFTSVHCKCNSRHTGLNSSLELLKFLPYSHQISLHTVEIFSGADKIRRIALGKHFKGNRCYILKSGNELAPTLHGNPKFSADWMCRAKIALFWQNTLPIVADFLRRIGYLPKFAVVLRARVLSLFLWKMCYHRGDCKICAPRIAS